jgi:ATP-binding cassette subfamily B protein
MIVLQFAATFSANLIPGIIGGLVDLYDKGQLDLDKLTNQSILILILGVSVGVLVLIRNFAVEFMSQRMERDTRDELYSSLLGKSLTFHDKQKIGDVMSRAATDVRQINFMMNPGFNLVFASIVSALMPLVFIAGIHPQLLITPVSFLFVYLIVLRWYNNQLSPWALKSRMAVSTINSRLNETLTGMHVVRGNAQENREKSIFRENIQEFRTAQVMLGKIQARYYPILILGIATAIAILHGIALYNDGIINIGELVTFILLFQLLRFPTFINIFAITVLTLGVAAARRILELIEGESLIDENPAGYSEEIKGEIVFDKVTFGYSSDTPVLKDISFNVKSGQTVALVGMTGSGKTSITKLLARLYDPQQGSISLDGIELNKWSINSLRSQMALVEQDIFLFSKSIIDNITLGMNGVSHEDIENAAKLARAHEFIMELSDGYNTEIGERGITLSGGQRQRIAIARAVIRNPRILILDDASSAIDSKTEDEINQAIREVLKNRVAFLITHRIAQIRKADVIVLLDQGKIIDIGTHEELLKLSPKYQEIFSVFDEDEKAMGVN